MMFTEITLEFNGIKTYIEDKELIDMVTYPTFKYNSCASIILIISTTPFN